MYRIVLIAPDVKTSERWMKIWQPEIDVGNFGMALVEQDGEILVVAQFDSSEMLAHMAARAASLLEAAGIDGLSLIIERR